MIKSDKENPQATGPRERHNHTTFLPSPSPKARGGEGTKQLLPHPSRKQIKGPHALLSHHHTILSHYNTPRAKHNQARADHTPRANITKPELTTSVRPMAAPHTASSICSSITAATALQRMLQSVVQSVRWTYCLFWRLCPEKGYRATCMLLGVSILNVKESSAYICEGECICASAFLHIC